MACYGGETVFYLSQYMAQLLAHRGMHVIRRFTFADLISLRGPSQQLVACSLGLGLVLNHFWEIHDS